MKTKQKSLVTPEETAKPEENWRELPATERQRALLHRLGVTKLPKNLTEGRASDRIESIIQKRQEQAETWREEPATEKQRALLESLGVTKQPQTKGEASDWINDTKQETLARPQSPGRSRQGQYAEKKPSLRDLGVYFVPA